MPQNDIGECILRAYKSTTSNTDKLIWKCISINKRHQQCHVAKCQPLRVVLTRCPRMEAAMKRLQSQSRQAPTQNLEPSVASHVDEKRCRLLNSIITNDIVTPSWPENVVALVSIHVHLLGEPRSEHTIVNIIAIIGRRCWSVLAKSRGRVDQAVSLTTTTTTTTSDLIGKSFVQQIWYVIAGWWIPGWALVPEYRGIGSLWHLGTMV